MPCRYWATGAGFLGPGASGLGEDKAGLLSHLSGAEAPARGWDTAGGSPLFLAQ